MMSIIKLTGASAAVVPVHYIREAALSLTVGSESMSVSLSPDQIGALIFALEMAAEELETAQARQRVICAGDALCTVPSACETPRVCGVAL